MKATIPAGGTEPGTRPGARLRWFYEDLIGMTLRPGLMYDGLRGEDRAGRAFMFMTVSCLLFSLLQAMLLPERRVMWIAIVFVNAWCVPCITAVVLYGVSLVVCRGSFTCLKLFEITAYAQVTVLLAWVPGLAVPMGVWKFGLMGFGLVKDGSDRCEERLCHDMHLRGDSDRDNPPPAGGGTVTRCRSAPCTGRYEHDDRDNQSSHGGRRGSVQGHHKEAPRKERV